MNNLPDPIASALKPFAPKPSESDTPETDAEEPRIETARGRFWDCKRVGGWVRADFARRLERERAAWKDGATHKAIVLKSVQAERDQLRAQLVARDEALKVAGDALLSIKRNEDPGFASGGTCRRGCDSPNIAGIALRRIEELTKP